MASIGPDWEALQRGLSGQIVLPGEDAYERARPPFIAWFDDIQPWAVVRCATPEDVAETVVVARRHRIRTATRDGGHSFAGYSTSKGQLANHTAVALADQLGTTVVDFPGDHGGFLALPQQFGRVLDQVLTETTCAGGSAARVSRRR